MSCIKAILGFEKALEGVRVILFHLDFAWIRLVEERSPRFPRSPRRGVCFLIVNSEASLGSYS